MRTASQAVAAAKRCRTNRPGYCLRQVWQWYGSPASRVPSAATASDAWKYSSSAHRHHDDAANAPIGAIIYLGARPGSSAGDVILKIGRDRYRATDIGKAGKVGTCTLAERAAMTGRPYVGYLTEVLGTPIEFAAAAASSHEKIEEDEDMKYERDEWPKAQKLARGKWETVRLGPKGKYRFAVTDKGNAEVGNIVCRLRVRGGVIDKQLIQARLLYVLPNKKRTTHKVGLELSDTEGDTFGTLVDNYSISNGTRVYVQVCAFRDGVELVDTTYSKLYSRSGK